MRRLEPPPGISVALLAMATVLYGAFADHPIPFVQSLWMGAFSLFLAAEIRVVYKERAKQDRAHERQIESIENLRQTADSRLAAMVRLLSAINDPAEGLKKRALQLSESILAFVYERQTNVPRLQPKPFIRKVQLTDVPHILAGE